MSDAPLYYIIRMTVPQDAGNPETFDVAMKLTTLTVAGFPDGGQIPVKFSQAAVNRFRPGGGIARDVFLGLATDLLIDGFGGVFGHAGGR